MFTVKLLIFCALCACAGAEMRTWTNSNGDQIDAELLEIIDEASIRILLASNRQTYVYPVDKLSTADRAYLDEVVEAQRQRRRAMLLSGSRRAPWLSDYERAKTDAQTYGLPMLVFFSGVQWDRFSAELKENVFDSREFQQFADRHLVLLQADSPLGSQPPASREVRERFSVQRIPTVLVLAPDESILARYQGYGGQAVPEYLQRLQAGLEAAAPSPPEAP